MTHHYVDPTVNPLDVIIDRLVNNNIFYYIEVKDNLVIALNTDDEELIQYSLNNNPDLVPV
tara:strand:- start:300 stop:482 length:183 start_codon:yes stop_codon:yes gene_type:complete